MWRENKFFEEGKEKWEVEVFWFAHWLVKELIKIYTAVNLINKYFWD